MTKRTVLIISVLALVGIAATVYVHIEKMNWITSLEKKMIIAHKNENYDQAISLANEILQRSELTIAYQVLSDCYYRKGQLDSSLKYAELAISHLPKDQYLYYLRGRILLQKGDLKGCSDITNAINAKGWFLTSENLTIDYMDTSRFMDINYRHLLEMRVKYCEQAMPEQAKIDREILVRGR